MQGDFSGKPGRARTEKGRSKTDCLVEPRSGEPSREDPPERGKAGGRQRVIRKGISVYQDPLRKASVGTKHTTLKGGLQRPVYEPF